MTLTPGAYLKHRRTAAGLSIDDVAVAVATDPKIAERDRAQWLEMIEADVVPANWTTIVALRMAFPFELEVLMRLSMIQLGEAVTAPTLCRICAIHQTTSYTAGLAPWAWAEGDLCVACTTPATAA